MPERTTVRLPEDLLARAKRKAADEGRTVTSLVEEGLRLVTDGRSRKAAKSKRVLPPISKATGGFRVDLASFSALQELEDAEYVEQMKPAK